MYLITRTLRKFAQARPMLYIYGGQGTQEKGMFSSLTHEFRAEAKQLGNEIRLDVDEITQTDLHNQINKTWVCQPLIVLSHYLQFKERKYQAQNDDYMIGHSAGEYSALVNSGSLAIKDALRLVQKRGELIHKNTKTKSGMLVIVAKSADLDTIYQLVQKHDLEIACVNSRSQLVIAGEKQKCQQLYAQLRKRKIISTFLPVSAAFHCRALKPMAAEFREILEKVQFKAPKCRVLRNIDGNKYTSKQDIVQGLVQQLYRPVMFQKSVMSIDKQVPYIEVGHKEVVTRFVKQIRSYM